MNIYNFSERSIRYVFTFLVGNNILGVFLTLAVHEPGKLGFLPQLLCNLTVSHVTAFVCLLSIDLFKPFLRKIIGGNETNLYISYILPLSIFLVPGLIAGFYAGTLVASVFNINWHPDVWGIIRPGILFGIIVFLLNFLYFNWIYSVRVKYQKELELKTAQTHLLESKLQLHMSELNPHLLFNSLNMIVEILRENSELAEKMLLKLCDYYQSVLVAFDKKSISLSEELELGLKFLELQQERYPNLHMDVQGIEPTLKTFCLPPLILQPIVENALKHGFRNVPRNAPKEIAISTETRSGRVQIKIVDSGQGDLTSPETARIREPHGLKNCERRLKLFFDESCELRLIKGPSGTTVILDLPYDKPNKK